jgi:hypothetical protein
MARKGGGLLLVGLGVLLGVGAAVAVPIVREPLATGEPRVSVAVKKKRVVVRGSVDVTTRIPVTVERVRGTARIGDETLQSEVGGPAVGAPLSPGTPAELQLDVTVPPLTAAKYVASAALGGTVPLRYEGTADVRVFGLPLSVPVDLRTTVRAKDFLK